MRRTCSLFIIYFLASVFAAAKTGHFTPANHFSSSLIADLCQDKQGYVWIATDYGLNRLDGYNFQTFLHSESDTTTLQSNVIVSLLCDSKGNLWVGTNKGLDCFDAATERFIHYRFPTNISPRVSSIVERRDGTLLIGTAGYGAYTISADNRLTLYSKPTDDQFYSNIFEDSRGRLWRVGLNDFIYMSVDSKTQSFRSDLDIPQGFVELDDGILVVCQHNIRAFRNGHLSMADIDMSAVAGKDVVFSKPVADAQGNIYIGTRGKGVYRVSSTRPRRLEHVAIDAFGIDMSTAKITTSMFDRDGNLWLACHQKGLLMVPQKPMQFSTWSFETQGIRLGSSVSSICEGDNGIVWCTVQGVGVYGFNAQGRVVAHPAAPDAVEFIFRDKLKRYWIGTDDGLFAYDPLTGRSELRVTFECDKFNEMTSDSQGNIYISTFSRGFCVYNPETGQLRNHSFDDADTINGRLSNNWIMGMEYNRQGCLWMATASGVSCYETKTNSFRSKVSQTLLDGTMCFDVCELNTGKLSNGQELKGCIAIGTESGLFLYNPAKRTLEPFPDSEPLQNKAISYIVQANNGDIWCSTSMGIWQYSLASHTFIGHIMGNGLTQKEYIYGVGMHTDDNRIFFGHNDGFTVFTPQDIVPDTTTPKPLQLTAFRVGDQYVNAATEINGIRITDQAVSESSHFTLSYLDHTVTLAFSQFDFDNPMNTILEYRVNQGSWISNPEGQNEFTLGHLQPGRYRIEVRALQGNEYTPVKVVVITVRAPWYRTHIAFIIYFLLVAALVAYLYYTMRRRAKRQLNEAKMKFLINATHDIRSPLTLILNALKKIEKSPAAETIENNTQRILNLVNQILDVRKIDKQQMHLHCQQTDMVAFVKGICKMYEFNATEHNIAFTYSHEGLDRLDAWIDRNQFDKVISNLLSNAFKYNSEQGQIHVSLASTESAASASSYRASAIPGGFPNGKKPSLILTVSDTGIGLDSDNIKHIFDRFYQGRNSREIHANGTGIGLNLCKMIVDMHHGTIEAANRTDGTRGSIFTVTLPLGNAHLNPEEIDTPATAANAVSSVPADSSPAVAPVGTPNSTLAAEAAAADSNAPSSGSASSGTAASSVSVPSAPASSDSALNGVGSVPENPAGGDVTANSVPDGTPAKPSSSRHHRVLIVDDDEELGQFIANELNRYYKCHICCNGKEALRELLIGGDYDAVVSDVMMPEMDGFTMLRMIKTNLNIAHIPVIMLTSMADVGNRLEGLERGADAFLAKPFDMEELHLTIENLILSRQRLKGKFTGAQQQADKLEQPEVKGNDEQLMERIMKAVNKNLADSDFNVEMLTHEVGISRAQLHRKMKEMTGLSTSEFIRNIRLEQAARLLKEQKINVTQVAYTVGFSNLAHFSTIFRKHFGVAPSEYAGLPSSNDSGD